MSALRFVGRNRIYFGWIAVALGMLVLAGATGSRHSFGVFLKPLTEEFGWSRASIAGALSVAGIATGLGRIIGGALVDRYEPRTIALIGMAMGGVALMGLSRVQELWQLYAFYTVMAAGFVLASPTTITKMVSPWFQRRRSFALGLAHSGGAMGEMLLVPAAGFILVASGWRTVYVALAALMLLILLPAVWRLGRSAQGEVDPAEFEDAEAEARGEPRRTAAESAATGMSLREALRMPIYWKLFAGFFA